MRVLVVEDDVAMASSLTWGLEAEGYVVDVAGNGEDGLWKARESAHDVIVLDVMLPGLDGYQVCQRLREQGVWTPILMLTAMDDDLDHAEGLDIGADDYLTKPFSYPILLAHLVTDPTRTAGEAGRAQRRRPHAGPGQPHGHARGGAGRADQSRGRGAGIPHAPPGPGRVQDGTARALLGRRLRRRAGRRRGSHPPTAPQDRSRVRRADNRHPSGRGIPDPAGRPVTRTAVGSRRAWLRPRSGTLR